VVIPSVTPPICDSIEKSRWRWPDLLLEGNLDEFTETRVH
jgi:hypothetical protein